jgi:hypothetical protein
MRPTSQGVRHFVTLLAEPSANAQAWSELPPLDGASRIVTKPTANVLAETSENAPLLVAHNFGNGRVMAYAGYATWHWWMHGHEDAHKRFWRQVVLWLARKDQSTEGNVWIKLEQRRFSPGSPVAFTAGARSPQGDPVADAQMTAEIVLPDGSRRPLPLDSSLDGEASGIFRDTTPPGEYKVVVNAAAGGKPLGQAEARFLVFQQDLELDNPAGDPATLTSLAKMTGGESLPPEQLTALLERLLENPPLAPVTTQTKLSVYDTWPWFLLLISLLICEWFLRKKWGLV